MQGPPRNDAWYQTIWYRFLDRLRALIGLQKTTAIDGDPYTAVYVLDGEDKETVEAVRQEAQEVQKFFPPMSKWQIGAGIIATCCTVLLGLMFIRRHFRDKEDRELR
jgi:hypothetical protein